MCYVYVTILHLEVLLNLDNTNDTTCESLTIDIVKCDNNVDT